MVLKIVEFYWNLGMGDMGKKIYNFFFSYQLISIIIKIDVKSLFLSSLKPDFCYKIKVKS